MALERVKLTQWNVDTGKPVDNAISLVVDFNPQSLRLTYNAVGPSGAQGTGHPPVTQKNTHQTVALYTDLGMDLLFDTSREGGGDEDVRQKTQKLADLMQPGKERTEAPVVHVQWGTFIFTGYIQSLTETIDYFSEQGRPLRANVSLSLREVQAARPAMRAEAAAGGGAGFSASASAGLSASAGVSASVGVTPLTLARSGDTLQSLTGRVGAEVSWKAVATANNVENPRLLSAGEVLNLNARAGVGN